MFGNASGSRSMMSVRGERRCATAARADGRTRAPLSYSRRHKPRRRRCSQKNVENKETGPITGGQALVDGLVAHGVDTVFALPGAQIYGFIDALAGSADKIRTIGARHEQTCATWPLAMQRLPVRPEFSPLSRSRHPERWRCVGHGAWM